MIWILRSNQVAACNSHKWRTNQLQRLFHSRLPTCPKHLKKVLCTGSGGAGAGAGGAGGAAGAGAGAGWRWSRWWWRLRFRLWLRWWEVFAQIIDFLSIYCGQTATFHCPCVPAFVALSLYLYLSLSCKSFVVSIRLEVAASSGHPPQKYIHSCPKYNHPLVSSTALKATRAPVQQSRPSLSPKVWRERPWKHLLQEERYVSPCASPRPARWSSALMVSWLRKTQQFKAHLVDIWTGLILSDTCSFRWTCMKVASQKNSPWLCCFPSFSIITRTYKNCP